MAEALESDDDTHRKKELRMSRPVPKGRKRTIRRRRRHLRRSVRYALIAIIAVVVLLAGFLIIPRMIEQRQLRSLGYSSESIAAIRQYGLSDLLRENQLYSDNLNRSLPQDNFRSDYLYLYLATDELSDDDFLLAQRLRERNYSDEKCARLFESLEFWEITPLLVFDYVADIEAYIQDCQNHRDVNSIHHFELDGTYVSWYSDPQPANTEDTSMLVNKQNYLTEEYQPDDLVELSLTYASSDRWMKQEAADAFIRMCDELNAGGSPRMYASSTYRDYAYQVELYEQYVARNGQQWADSIAARPGYSEHQTGLTADVASTASGGLSQFEDSEEFQWMQQNAHRFGWILRYPQGKQTLTGYDYESWHYRYLGVELATQVYQSGLTYDEYYALYLAD